MPGGDYDALTAARFQITLDGHSIGLFEVVLAATAPGALPRPLQVNELPLLLQSQSSPSGVTSWDHQFEFRPGKFAQWDPVSKESLTGKPRPGRSLHKVTDVTLKRGVCSQASIGRWKALGARDVVLVALGQTGQPVARYTLTNAWPSKMTGPVHRARSGGEVAIEEIVIAHEGMKFD